MTTLAFKATYSDWKLIKTRGVVQVVMEVPLSESDAAYQILGGMPDFSQDRWFAVAPLKLPPAAKEISSTTSATPRLDQPTVAAKREKMDWRELQPAAQAGIRCADPVFWKFLEEQDGCPASNPDEAASIVRFLCGVKSRAELGTNHKARIMWKQLDDMFQAWKLIDA